MFKSIKCLFTPYNKKVNVLTTKTYDYYYTILINNAKTQNAAGVQIPIFAIEQSVRKQALAKAKEELEKVIAEKRVHRCYKKAICG